MSEKENRDFGFSLFFQSSLKYSGKPIQRNRDSAEEELIDAILQVFVKQEKQKRDSLKIDGKNSP